VNEPLAAEADDVDAIDDIEADASDTDEAEGTGGGAGSGAGPSQPLPPRRAYDLDAPRPDERPTRRADCLPGGANAARPCPFVTCASHAVHGVLTPSAYGLLDPEEVIARAFDPARPSCVLDIIDDHPGGVTLDGAGDLFRVTRERARQMEQRAFTRVLPRLRRRGITEADVREILGAFEDVSGGGPQSGRGKTRVRAADDFRRERPAVAAHLPGPGEVEPGGTFWCDTIHAALPTVLCNLRHTAVSAYPQNVPVHRACAACPDGAALLARVAPTRGPVQVDAPERRRLPVIGGTLLRDLTPNCAPPLEDARPVATAFEGPEDPTPTAPDVALPDGPADVAADEATDDPIPAAGGDTPHQPTMPPTNTKKRATAKSPKCGTYFQGEGSCALCKHPAGNYRGDLPEEFKVLCAGHRATAQTHRARKKCTPTEAVEYVRGLVARQGGDAPPLPRRKVVRAPAPSAAPHRPPPPLAESLGQVKRLAVAVEALGGLEAVEVLVPIVRAFGGAASLRDTLASLGVAAAGPRTGKAG